MRCPAWGLVMLMIVAGWQVSRDRTVSPTAQASAAGAYTANCTSAETRQLVERFIDSFNTGNTKQLDQLVAGPEMFQWYSTDAPGQRIGPEARNRSGLIAYFAHRHDQHERLVLVSFDFTANSAIYGGFQFELIRISDDGLLPTPYVGKGALVCSKTPRTLAVWSMARSSWWASTLFRPFLVAGLVIVIMLVAGWIGWHRWRQRLERYP